MLSKKSVLLSISILLIFILSGCRQKTTILITSPTETTTTVNTEPIEASSLSVGSPNKNINVLFALDINGVPSYSLVYKGEILIKPSSLGFNLKDQNPLRDHFKIVNYSTKEFNETWEPVWGEKSAIINHYNELTIELEETTNNPRKMHVIFRVFDNGIGFRYIIPEQEHLNAKQIMSENTEFRFTGDHTAWWIPNDWDSYEYLYHETPLSEVREVSTPLTMKTKEGVYLTLHEAALIDYAGMALKKGIGNTLISSLCPWPDGVKVKGYTPLTTPWRTIEIGDDAGELVESDLILNLNEPSKIEDPSWIQPMKYVGIWWEMHIDQSTWSSGSRHGATTENAKRYIDFAHEFLDSSNQPIGLLVEGWNIGWDGNWIDNGHLFDFTTAYRS